MATNQDKIATIGDIRNLLSTAREKGVTIKNESGAEWSIPSSFNDDSLCVTYRQLNGTVLPQYSANATDKISSTDGVVISNFKGGTVAYSDSQLVRLGDITLKSVYLADNSFEVGVISSANTSCAVSATCQYTYGVNEASYTYEATAATITTVTSSGTSGTWSGTDSSTSNTLSNQGANSSFTDTRSFTISCSTTIGGQNVSDSTTIVQPTREQGQFISSSSTADSHALEFTVDKTSFGCDGGAANVTIYHVYGSSTSTTYEDTCGVQYTVVSGDGRQRENVGTSAYTIPAISCNAITGSTTKSHTLTAAYTYQDSASVPHEITGSTSVSQECESCQMAYKYTMTDGTVQSGTCFFDTLAVNTIQGSYYHKAQKIEIFDCITGFSNSSWSYFGGKEITSITMSDNVVALPQEFASGAGKLKYVKLSAKLKTIPMTAFHSCKGLTEINFIPNGVETIGKIAFMNCESASSATIPSSVTAIGEKAFKNCYGLKDIYMRPTTPPTIMSDTFDNLPSDYIIHVPCDSETAYKTASDVWRAISSHVVGDCSCNSCYTISTSELSDSAAISNTLVCTCQVTSSQSICSTLKRYVPDISAITVDGNWLTVSRTNATSARDGFRVYATYSENTSEEERICKLTIPLVSSNSELACGNETLEVNLVQKGSSEVETCSIVGGYHHTCSTLPSGTLLSYRSITSDTESCSSIRFESTDFEMKYESQYINVDYLQIADNGKTIQVYGSMDSNLSGHEVGAVLSVTATTSNGIKEYDIPIEQEACSECWDCFQLNNSNSGYTHIGDDGKTIYANASGSTSQSDTLININKKNGGICSDYAMYTNLELIDNGYGTDWINILHFNEAGGNYIVTSGGMSPNNTNNLRTCTFRYTASAGTSCPIDILVIQPSSPNSCYNLHSSDIPYSASTNAIVADIIKTGTTNVCDTMPSFFDNATVIKGSYWITNATTQDKGNNDTGLYLSYTKNTTQSRRYGVVRLSSSTNPQVFFDCELYQRAAPIEEFQITGVTLQHVCKEDRKAYYTIDYKGTAPSNATCTVRTFQNVGDKFVTSLTGVTVNEDLKSIPIHDGAISGETIQLTVIPDSGVNTSSTSFTATIESNNWRECSGTITLTSRAASILTTGSTSEMRYTLGLSYSGSNTIDTSNASITLYAYNNITTENKNCLQCVDNLYDNEPLCEYDISLTQNEIAKLVTKGLLRVTKTISIGNNSPNVCNYQDKKFYGIYGISNTTSIKIGDGFLANRLGKNY